MKKILGILLLVLTSQIAHAEVAYVFDQIKVWTHTGPSNNYKVKYRITPGDKFEVLQKNAETGFVQIKDELGRVAWLDSKYLTKKPTASRLLSDAHSEIERLKKSNAEQVQNLQRKVRELSPLQSTNSTLQSDLAQLKMDYDQTRQEKETYKGRFIREYFFSGAIVFIGGMFFGWVLSKLGGKKRSSGWN